VWDCHLSQYVEVTFLIRKLRIKSATVSGGEFIMKKVMRSICKYVKNVHIFIWDLLRPGARKFPLISVWFFLILYI